MTIICKIAHNTIKKAAKMAAFLFYICIFVLLTNLFITQKLK